MLGQREFGGLIDEVPSSTASCSPGWPGGFGKTPRSVQCAASHRGAAVGSPPCAGLCPAASARPAHRLARGRRHVGVGHRPAGHRVARRLADRARGLRQHPGPARLGLLPRGGHGAVPRARGWCRCGCATTSAAQPDDRRTNKRNVHRRLRDFRAGVWMRTLLRDPAAGIMHSLIYFGFLVLFIVTVVLEIDHQLPESLKFLHGRTYQAYAFVGDLFGLVFIAGILWAFGRRYGQRPYRIRIKTKPEHAVILFTFLVDRGHRVHHRGVAHRASDGPRPTSRSGRSSAAGCRRCSTSWSVGTPPERPPLVVDRPRRRVPRVPRDPAHHDAAPHDHEPDEHVPAGPRRGPRAR